MGFFAQLKGKLTKKRYRYCTVFVDHYSQLHFILPLRPSLPSKNLRSLLPSTVFAFNTITVVIDDLLTRP
jgi:hypothetical protein